MGKERLDRVDGSTMENVVANSLKLAVTDLIISRYANESQTYVITKDAMSVEEAADNLIDYARHMSSGKYMYAILAGIDKQFTHECVAEFIRNSPAIMDQIRSNVAAKSKNKDDAMVDSPLDVKLRDPDVLNSVVDPKTDQDILHDIELEDAQSVPKDENVLHDSDSAEVEVGFEPDPEVVDFIFDPEQPNGIKWKD